MDEHVCLHTESSQLHSTGIIVQLQQGYTDCRTPIPCSMLDGGDGWGEKWIFLKHDMALVLKTRFRVLAMTYHYRHDGVPSPRALRRTDYSNVRTLMGRRLIGDQHPYAPGCTLMLPPNQMIMARGTKHTEGWHNNPN